MVAVAEVTNEEANDLADEILGREEFISASEPGIFQRAVDRVFEEIGDVLGRIFGAIFGGAGGAAGTAIAIVLLVLAVGLLLFAIIRAIAHRTPKQEEQEVGARIVFDEVVEPEQLRGDMDRYIAAGDWRAAVIAGFRLSIVGLIDANIAREISGATTGDFANAVAAQRPQLLEVYRSGAWSFDRAFYSDNAIDERDMARVRNLLDQIEGSTASAGTS